MFAIHRNRHCSAATIYMAIFAGFTLIGTTRAVGGGDIVPVNAPVPAAGPAINHFAMPAIPPKIFGINEMEHDKMVVGPALAPSPSIKHPRKMAQHGATAEEANVEHHDATGRKLIGTLQPVSYTAEIVVENHLDEKLMPAIKFTDKRYYETTDNNALHNLLPGQSLSFLVPYDVQGVDVWSRINCNDDGTHCQSGGCNGKNGDHVHCQGTDPSPGQPAWTTFSLSLREGKNVYSGVDHYKAVPYSSREAFHLTVSPSNVNCPMLDVRTNIHKYTCDNSNDRSQQRYTMRFYPLDQTHQQQAANNIPQP